MDANDAASYVQELTGDDANIIFGAMYDDSVADYARITVIATGLSDTSSKPSSSLGGRSTSPFSVRRPSSAANSTGNQNGMNMPTFTMPTMHSSYGNKMPSSTVQKKDIQIPDFLKNR